MSRNNGNLINAESARKSAKSCLDQSPVADHIQLGAASDRKRSAKTPHHFPYSADRSAEHRNRYDESETSRKEDEGRLCFTKPRQERRSRKRRTCGSEGSRQQGPKSTCWSSVGPGLLLHSRLFVVFATKHLQGGDLRRRALPSCRKLSRHGWPGTYGKGNNVVEAPLRIGARRTAHAGQALSRVVARVGVRGRPPWPKLDGVRRSSSVRPRPEGRRSPSRSRSAGADSRPESGAPSRSRRIRRHRRRRQQKNGTSHSIDSSFHHPFCATGRRRTAALVYGRL